MRIREITEPSDVLLFEQLDADNDTSISTEDLVRVVRQERSGIWSEPMSGDDMMEYLRKLADGG